MQKKVIIIGGGPAGMSAALWLKNFGIEPIILEKSNSLGGLIGKSYYKNIWVLGQIGETGKSLTEKFVKHIENEKIEVGLSTEVTEIKKEDGFTVVSKNKDFNADGIIIATGARFKGKEDLENIKGFAENKNRFFFGPASWLDDGFHTDKEVTILGGGDNAFDVALILSKVAKKINIISRSKPRARKDLVDPVTNLGNQISTYYETEIKSFQKKDEKVITKTTSAEISSDSIIVLYGYLPNSEVIVLPELKKDSRGFIEVDKNCRTSMPLIYAVGEVTDLGNPCVATSIAHGTIAARSFVNDIEHF